MYTLTYHRVEPDGRLFTRAIERHDNADVALRRLVDRAHQHFGSAWHWEPREPRVMGCVRADSGESITLMPIFTPEALP